MGKPGYGEGEAPITAQADAVIVGGGVAGAAMGVALGRFGTTTIMLERRKRVGEINRGDALQIAAVRTLDRLGALEPLLQAGAVTTETVSFSHYRQGRLGGFYIPDLFDPPHNSLLTLSHERIESTLIAEAQGRGIVVRRGHAVREIRREADRMILSVASEEGDYELQARLVIGADGKSSTVRRYFGEEPDTYWYEQECVVVEAENPDGVPRELRLAYHPDGFLVIAPLSPTVVRIYIISLGNDAARIFKMRADDIGALAVQRDPLLEGYRFIKEGGHIFKMGLYHCRQYVSEGCALIGDAAHITSPAGGQGMNLAINDADALADRIGSKLAGGNSVTLNGLKGYESERYAANEKALRYAHRMFMQLTGPQWRYRLTRPLFFWVMSHLSAVRTRIARPMLSLGASPSRE